MNSRFAMMGMSVLLVAACAAIVYFGTREPERHAPAPLAQLPSKVVTVKQELPPLPPPPAVVETPKPKRDDTRKPAQEAPAVEGMVVDRAHAPIAGATIHIGASNGPEAATSGTDGRFTLAPPIDAEAQLTATHPDFLPRTVALAPSKETPQRITIALEKAGGIAGTVLRGGQPAAGMEMFEDDSRRSTKTDAQGRYLFDSMPAGSFVIRAGLGPGLGDNTTPLPPWLMQKVEVQAGSIATADFDLPDCDSAIEGFVVFEEQPLPQARLKLQIDNSRGPYHSTVETGPDGGYHMGTLPDGAVNLQLSIPLANGGTRQKTVRFELKPHETNRQDFDFPTAGTLQGHVKGLRDGEQATVLAFRGQPQQFDNMSFEQLVNMHQDVAASTAVASDGTFAFEALDPGDYVLMLTAGQPDTAEFRSASQFVTVIAGNDAPVRFVLR